MGGASVAMVSGLFGNLVLIAERSEASNPGRTTEMGVLLCGSPSSFWYIYDDGMCTDNSDDSL